jgi:hypothetical protein
VTDETTPTLKLVVAWSPRRNLCSIVGDHLSSLVPTDNLRAIGDDAHVVYTALTTDALRDGLRKALDVHEGLLVTEFEVWSGYGQSLDAKWLLARGH